MAGMMRLNTQICFVLLASQYPEMMEHHGKVGSLPGIKKYVESGKRHAKVNNNNLG